MAFSLIVLLTTARCLNNIIKQTNKQTKKLKQASFFPADFKRAPEGKKACLVVFFKQTNKQISKQTNNEQASNQTNRQASKQTNKTKCQPAIMTAGRQALMR